MVAVSQQSANPSSPWVPSSEDFFETAIANELASRSQETRPGDENTSGVQSARSSQKKRLFERHINPKGGVSIIRAYTAQKEANSVPDDTVGKSEMQAHIAASDARTDAKFAELRGEISTMRAELTGEFKSLQSAVQASLGEFKSAISEVNLRMSHVEETAKLTRSDARSSKWQVIGTLIALFALSVGFLSWGGAQFSAGQSTAEIARSAARAETEAVVRKAIDDAIKATRQPVPDQKP